MRNLAVVILDGNLVRDPETKQTKSNKTVTTFSIALNHEWGSKDGNKSVSYIQIETWERLAENCAAYLKKGRHVTVHGDLRQDRWEDENGNKRERLKILARDVRFDSFSKKEEEEAVAA